jgi:hypothetical protein
MKPRRTPRALWFFAFLFATGSSSWLGALLAQASQGLPSGRPEEVGMSSDRLARIRAAMQVRPYDQLNIRQEFLVLANQAIVDPGN